MIFFGAAFRDQPTNSLTFKGKGAAQDFPPQAPTPPDAFGIHEGVRLANRTGQICARQRAGWQRLVMFFGYQTPILYMLSTLSTMIIT